MIISSVGSTPAYNPYVSQGQAVAPQQAAVKSAEEQSESPAEKTRETRSGGIDTYA
jgi:hypothetical protein